MRLLLDEHIDKALAEQLRRRGHDVVAVTEEEQDLIGTADDALLEWASGQRRAIVTYNVRRFMALVGYRLATLRPFSGVVLLSVHRFPEGKERFGQLLRALEELLAAHPGDDALLNRYVWL